MAHHELLDELRRRGLVQSAAATATPLSGGVSSEILLIEDGPASFVLKRALPKLKVKDDWFADVSRNRYEQQYLRYVGTFLPDAVPKVLHSDPDRGYFIMEYLGDGYRNWKKLLLEGIANPLHAQQAGRMLGTIHGRSWGDPAVAKVFDTTGNFHQLRIEPYLVTTGQRHPDLRRFFEIEAQRLAQTHQCLVHGDYSPKNILIGPADRMVILDCEVAWYGDPAFDIAFLLNHFVLKSLYHAADPSGPGRFDGPLDRMAAEAWWAYLQQLTPEQRENIEPRTATLVLMLMLARIDGKSPVEYLTDEPRKQLVRRFVYDTLPRYHGDLSWVLMQWRQRLDTLGLAQST